MRPTPGASYDDETRTARSARRGGCPSGFAALAARAMCPRPRKRTGSGGAATSTASRDGGSPVASDDGLRAGARDAP